MDIFTVLLSLLLIVGLIIGATIRINSLMKGKIINALFNKKILFIIASLLAFLFTLAFVIAYFDGFVFSSDDYFWFAYTIAVIFAVAHYTPILISYLMEIHQSNLEDIKEQELKEAALGR